MVRLAIIACLQITGVQTFSILGSHFRGRPISVLKNEDHRIWGGATRRTPLELQSVPRRQALRDVFRGAATVAAAAAAAAGSEVSAAETPTKSGGPSRTGDNSRKDRAAERNRLKEELSIALREPSLPPVPSGSNREASINALLDQLERLNPARETWLGSGSNEGEASAGNGGEERGGEDMDGSASGSSSWSSSSSDSFGVAATGTWRVAFAPHIAKLSGLAGVKFDPILYGLNAATNSIESHVQYKAPLGLQGWLNTRGVYGRRPPQDTNNKNSDNAVSFVEWEEAWWNPGPAPEPGAGPASGALAPVVSAIAKQGFVPAFANFPVSYLDKDLCVFVFPLSNTRIVAVRQGGVIDPWRS